MPACDDLMDVSDVPDQAVLLAGEIAAIRAVLGEGVPEGDIVGALARCGSNPERAINALLDSLLKDSNGGDAAMALIKVKIEKPEVGGGALMPLGKVKVEEPEAADTKAGMLTSQEVELKKEQSDGSSRNDPSIAQGGIKKVSLDDLYPMVAFHVKKEQPDDLPVRDQSTVPHDEVKEQFDGSFKKDDVLMGDAGISFVPRPKKRPRDDDETVDLTTTHPAPYLNPRPIRAIPPSHAMSLMPPEPVRSFAPPEVTDRRLVLVLPEAEVGEFPEEPDWFIAGKSYVTGLSTCRGRRLMDAGEIVHFNFPSGERRFGGINVKAKTGAALASIVRFSTKRSGEIGKLTPEWTRCLVPLVSSSKVKIQGRCVFPTVELRLMQEIVLYVSFYIHSSVFTEGNGSWNLIAPANIDNTVNPLLTLFNLLKIKPFKKADFTPEELNTRKRPLNLRDDEDEEESCHVVGLEKRRTGGQTYPEQSTDEQAISESSLNKIVGTAEIYDLEEAEPPSTLVSVLRPYQKQALFWMSEREKGTDVEQAAKTLHPCWNAYNVDKRASAVYVNVFSGEATTQFPSATQMARGGILADAMGLGKTVMTIALILSNPKGEWSDQQESYMEGVRNHKTRVHTSGSSMKGGTLIVCPMALLGQWKDELEAHSTPGALSVFVYYGGDKTDNLKVMTEHSVVLTTYGVLSSAYQPDSGGVFHKIDWYRVVLDEAHTIKSSKTKVAQAAFGLSSHCRWCLTGTPLQNNLEDLYSLLCFLHVEPWCNAAWWQKLIQKPYENGDERGLRLVKAILRPLMLRRTKETKDKMGNPILVLPPAHVEVVECEQSEAERDFYDALFRRSKVRFNQFVAQGKVLHNYASILELLLRLRQCCNHPFLVMSRGNTQQPADLDKLARRFLEGPRSDSGRQAALPTRAYVEEVVEGIRQGVVAECPICLESASDDPVLTPCAHRMCRECLLYSWRTPSGGPCPICRSPINKADLITCPSESRFQFDISNNWKESCKVRKLLGLLESLQKKREKSIVFSQWTGFFDLLEIPLCNKKIQFLRFDGKLSQKQRERVLKEFSESHDKLVLLMSLKAGGVGLNLTAASNVFLMDPWWNPAVEEQAIMRIHRIGQKRTVHVRRFIVKDTVEERMQQVQARKQRMISGALTDEEVRTARIEELKMLFT